MTRVAAALFVVAIAVILPLSCSYDWERFDPRLGTETGGAAGSTTTSSTSANGGSGGSTPTGSGGAGGTGGIAPTGDRYRSVGPGNSQPLTTGSGNELTISGITATFANGLPDNVGVGDVVQYDIDDDGDVDGDDALAFIHARLSAAEYEVRDARGDVPPAVSGDSDWAIHRAYTALADAVTGIENTAITAALRDFDSQARDLVAEDAVWHVACYADGIDDTPVLIDGWTTSPVNYLRIFTPTGADQVGASQRHDGTAGTGYVLDTSIAPPPLAHVIELRSDHVRLEGLEITGWVNDATTNSWEGVSVHADGALLDALLVHDDIHPATSNPNADAINLNGMQDGWTVTVRNSIVYNISRGAINYQELGTPVVVIDNCTIFNTGTSGADADGEGGIAFANSSVADVTVTNTISVATVVGSADFTKLNDTWGSSSNNISTDTSAPGSGSLTGVSAANLFVSTTAQAEDLHLLPGAAAIDAGIDRPDFAIDIDGQPRQPGVWDIGADEHL